ncbi:hypothetical protein [Rhizobium herbae]
MSPFRTAILDNPVDAQRRLGDFGLTIQQMLAIRDSARAAADDASPLMPLNAPGTLAYIHGVGALRGQILDSEWVIDRTLGVEAVINHGVGIRIGYQNVDRACDPNFPPMPRSEKGNGVARLCRLPLFEHFGVVLDSEIDRLPSENAQDPHGDQVSTYFAMVGEDGSVELSSPIIASKRYADFVERIFIDRPDEEWQTRLEPNTDPIDDFEVPVIFKDKA